MKLLSIRIYPKNSKLQNPNKKKNKKTPQAVIQQKSYTGSIMLTRTDKHRMWERPSREEKKGIWMAAPNEDSPSFLTYLLWCVVFMRRHVRPCVCLSSFLFYYYDKFFFLNFLEIALDFCHYGKKHVCFCWSCDRACILISNKCRAPGGIRAQVTCLSKSSEKLSCPGQPSRSALPRIWLEPWT